MAAYYYNPFTTFI